MDREWIIGVIEAIGREIEGLLRDLGIEEDYFEICVEVDELDRDEYAYLVRLLRDRYHVIYVAARCEEGMYRSSFIYKGREVKIGIRPLSI